MARSEVIDLTQKAGCYSKELSEFRDTIEVCMKSPYVSLREMKDYVLNLVHNCKRYEALPAFEERIENCETKNQIFWQCCGAIKRGKNFNTNFSTSYRAS